MTDEVIEQNPTENALTEVVPEVAEEPIVVAAEPEVIADPPPETDVEADKRKNPWFLKRISETSERARVAEEEAANLKAMLERLQAGKETPAATPASNSPDFQTAVQREAGRLLFEQDRRALVAAGQKEFGAQEFNGIAAILGAAGAATEDFIQDVMAVDKPNAHKILATLAQDPGHAASLAEMDPRSRTAAITRMSMAATAPTTTAPKAPATPAKQVSRAPAPPPPVEPSATKTVPWYSDEASDADFDKGFYDPNRMKKRQRL